MILIINTSMILILIILITIIIVIIIIILIIITSMVVTKTQFWRMKSKLETGNDDCSAKQQFNLNGGAAMRMMMMERLVRK